MILNEKLTIRRHIQDFKCYYGVNNEMFFPPEQKLQTLKNTERNVQKEKPTIVLKRLPKATKVQGLWTPFNTVMERQRQGEGWDGQPLKRGPTYQAHPLRELDLRPLSCDTHSCLKKLQYRFVVHWMKISPQNIPNIPVIPFRVIKSGTFCTQFGNPSTKSGNT